MITSANIKRIVGKAVLASGLALAAVGFVSGTAQAMPLFPLPCPSPPPAPPPIPYSIPGLSEPSYTQTAPPSYKIPGLSVPTYSRVTPPKP